jgi:hypothetical protein
MSQDIRHRAADEINILLKAHVSDGSEKVDVPHAIGVRDDLREAAYDDEIDDRDLPSPGDIMYDGSPPSWSDNNRLEVTAILSGIPANEYVVCGPNSGSILPSGEQHYRDETVADKNPSYRDETVLVRATYVTGSDSEYVFPLERLEEP